LHNHRRRAAFDAAVKAYGEAYARRDLEAARKARADVVATRNAFCQSCQEVAGKLSPKVEACKAEWERMRKEAGGCANTDCRERGPNAWQVLQANHLDPETKVHIVSDYPWWAKKDWTVDQCVSEMRKEAAKCNFLCGFCHALDEHSNSANRRGDPDAMPPGKRGKHATEEEVAQYHAKLIAKICFPKQEFVDAEKLRRGCCTTCHRAVAPKTCVAFHFDHRDERTKMTGKDTLARKQGGVCGLVNNSTKRASLDEIRPILVAEMDKCDLLCQNCHHRKTRYD
jgi:hypothetical protein